MDKVTLSEIKNLVEYEKARDAMRAAIIACKQRRRIIRPTLADTPQRVLNLRGVKRFGSFSTDPGWNGSHLQI